MMRAAVFHDVENIQIKEVPDPVPREGEVIVRPKYCGICGTDLGNWKYDYFGSGVVLGHEFAGEIIKLGPGVDTWNVGDRVVPNSLIPCKRCNFCLEGKFTVCEGVEMLGVTINGGMADLVVLPADTLYEIPETMSWQEATLVEPLAIVLHAFNRIDFKVGQSILILGVGTIGLLAVKVAQISGAGSIAISEPNKFRRNLAAKFGPIKINNPHQTPPTHAFEDPFDHVIECSGVASVAGEAFSLLKKGGTLLVLGLSADPVEADFFSAVLNEYTIQFSYFGFSEFPAAIKLISNRIIEVNDLITKSIKLEDVVHEGFQELMKSDTDNVKILVEI